MLGLLFACVAHEVMIREHRCVIPLLLRSLFNLTQQLREITEIMSKVCSIFPPPTDNRLWLCELLRDPALQLQILRLGARPGRGGRNAKGAAEYVNSLVSSTLVAWSDFQGNVYGEELVFPPRQLGACSAEQIFRGLLANFERFAFGKSWNEFMEHAAKQFQQLSICAVGDSASANMKGIVEVFAFLREEGQKHGILVTSLFSQCPDAFLELICHDLKS